MDQYNWKHFWPGETSETVKNFLCKSIAIELGTAPEVTMLGAGFRVRSEPDNVLLDSKAFSTESNGAFTIEDIRSSRSPLGAIGVKASLGLMQAFNSTHLIARTVTHQGQGFWAHLGLLPIIEKHTSLEAFCLGLQDCYEDLLSRRPFSDSVSDGAHENYKTMCLKYPLHAWMAAAQCNTLVDGTPARKHFFEALQTDGILYFVLLPGDAVTRTILGKRLGRIPYFEEANISNAWPRFWAQYAREKANFPEFAHDKRFLPNLPVIYAPSPCP